MNMLRVFRLNRIKDMSGVSGTGVVAYGTVYPSGKVTLAWCVEGRPASVAIYDDFEAMLEVHVHYHKSNTVVEWLGIDVYTAIEWEACNGETQEASV